MKLTVDEKGRLSCAELFRPKASFDATVLSDGSIRLVELSQAPVVQPRKVDGRLRGAKISLSPETVSAAIRAERDSR